MRAQPEAELVGIADAHTELLERAKKASPGVAVYTDWVTMLDEARPEAVTVTAPNKRHLEVVRECARRRMHVWFQKPLAASGADAREMERLAREARITLMASYHTI